MSLICIATSGNVYGLGALRLASSDRGRPVGRNSGAGPFLHVAKHSGSGEGYCLCGNFGVNWFAGNSYGVLLGKTLASTPKYLTYGASFSIAGGGSVAAVATDESHYIGAKPASLKARSSALTPISGADLHRRSP